MDSNNPAEMSNANLEKDMQQKNEEIKHSANQENVSKSTAAEGTLISPSEDPSSAIARSTTYDAGKEQDLTILSTGSQTKNIMELCLTRKKCLTGKIGKLITIRCLVDFLCDLSIKNAPS